MGSIFTTYLTQYNAVLTKFFYIATFFSMRNSNRPITYFHIAYFKFFTNSYIIFKLISDQEGFKQSSAKINGHVIFLIDFQFLFQVWRYERSTKTKFYDVNVRAGSLKHVAGFLCAQAFIHYHGQATCSWLFCTFRYLRKMKIHEFCFKGKSKILNYIQLLLTKNL